MSKPTYISLFSSAGVGCYGFLQNDFDCIATNEIISDRLEVQKANHKCKYDTGYILGDIKSDEVHKALFEQVEYWKKIEGVTQVDVVFATPPCQGMSTANYKKSDNEQVRNSLVVEAIKIIKTLEPKIFILENVRAFMKTICTDISGEDMTIEESIKKNLSSNYNIFFKVINFKDYGIPSSRPRTLVIGTSKKLLNISPLNLFPTRQQEITLKDAIGDLAPLAFCERDKQDGLHFARPFPEYMLPWIENLNEGQSAFSNSEDRKPYKIDKSGHRIQLKGAYMGNKYRRLFWDKPCACIATRNDQLASQDTIHPTDNRVLSIRELMRVMTIPDAFKWTSCDESLSVDNAPEYLKKHELNIRRCIGEAVPTKIISQIAAKIKTMLDFESFVTAYYENKDIENPDCSNFYIDTFLQEQNLNIDDAKKTGVFYTPQTVVFNAIKDVKPQNEAVRILEPAVGLGAFLPQVCSLFSESTNVHIDVVEINPSTVCSLRNALNNIDLGTNIHIEFHISDFLTFSPADHYDYIFTNPPYSKSDRPYPELTGNLHRTKNLFALFMIKFRDFADNIICVIPKNFLMADEFESVRELYVNLPIVSICDYGVRFFKKVFIEIISIHFSNNYSKPLIVTDFINNRVIDQPQNYIYHDRVWLIYRNRFFDDCLKKLTLNVFTSFRDRQITNSKVSDTGKIRVLKSKNILDNGEIIEIPGYDRYLDSVTNLAVAKYMNSRAIIMPNFTYNTRASILPDNTVPNGSIAILLPKSGFHLSDLSFYATKFFREYYAIVKSYSRFTLNIDNCSLYYIGIPNEQI